MNKEIINYITIFYFNYCTAVANMMKFSSQNSSTKSLRPPWFCSMRPALWPGRQVCGPRSILVGKPWPIRIQILHFLTAKYAYLFRWNFVRIKCFNLFVRDTFATKLFWNQFVTIPLSKTNPTDYFSFGRFSAYMNSTAHNWQNWRRVFLSCYCHESYMIEAVGLKSFNYTFKNYNFESENSFAHMYKLMWLWLYSAQHISFILNRSFVNTDFSFPIFPILCFFRAKSPSVNKGSSNSFTPVENNLRFLR